MRQRHRIGEEERSDCENSRSQVTEFASKVRYPIFSIKSSGNAYKWSRMEDVSGEYLTKEDEMLEELKSARAATTLYLRKILSTHLFKFFIIFWKG
jgi:hypothetical protein